MHAPIALFVYNRPWHTHQVLEALRNNELADESELFIFSDGPTNNDDLKSVEEVRSIIKQPHGFKKTHIIEGQYNRGLKNSLLSGINEVFNAFDKIIVLEDDILTSKTFLYNINYALNRFKNEEDIIAITGYTFPHKLVLPELFAVNFPAVWGWATWKRGWNNYNNDGEYLYNSLKEKNLLQNLDHNFSFPYSEMLLNEISGKLDSWGIKWYASAVLHKKLTLMFSSSLVNNIGHDNSGKHSGSTNVHDVSMSDIKFNFDIPVEKNNNIVSGQIGKYLNTVLYDSYLKLSNVCDERLRLIHSLVQTSEDRLEIIKRLENIINNK